MKRYFLLLVVLSFSLLFEAKEVSYDEALSKASEFFTPASSSKKQIKAIKKNLSLATTYYQKIENDKPAFYIINNGENGFVIVSADDNAKTILGYSDENSFDVNNVPDNLKFWLNRYAEEISYIAKNGGKKQLYANVSYTPVEPLLGRIEHNQNAPYNNMCPELSFNNSSFNGRAVAGCVATAAVQIMTKWRYPNKGKGTVKYTYEYDEYNKSGNRVTSHQRTIEANLNESTYDWNNILDKYTSNYTTAQANAIARLVRDAGYASEMYYNIGDFGGSGTSDLDMAIGWVKHFSYDKGLQLYNFNKTYKQGNAYGQIIYNESVIWNPQEEVMEELYAELQAGRPIFCAGQSEKGGGHAFVCDGIQADGKLHINWGWGGMYNNYYELTAFEPGTGGIGAGTGAYTQSISFLTNIKPDAGSTESPLNFGVRNQSYAQTTNEFNKSETTAKNLFKVTNTYGKNIVYAGSDYFNLGYTNISQIAFGYALCKNDVTMYGRAAPWIIDGYNLETNQPEEMDLNAGQFTGWGLDITPTGSIATLVKGVNNGVYDLHMAVKDYAIGTFYPVLVWNRGKVRNKIAVGKNKVYIYPASEKNYSRNNTPTNLKATKNGNTYTLSWTGNASNYILLTWDEDDLTVEKLSSKTKSGVNAGKNWAIFACETSSSITYATSHIAYGDVLPIISDEPEKTDILVKKVWNDNDNQDGLRTSSVTIKLLVDGKDAGKTVTLNADNSWTSTFANLDVQTDGKYIVYTVEEPSVPTGYTHEITGKADETTGFTITNTHRPETKNIKVTKVWDDNENQDGSRPTSITIKLLADSKDAGKTVTLNESNNWTSTFSDLDAKANGKDIVYTVEESSVPTGYTPSISGTADDGFTITNTHTPAPTPETKNIKVTKVWDDNENQDGSRPTSVTIKLLADGKEAKSETLSASNGWTYTFTNLDAKANGTDIVYTAEESSVPTGYTPSISGTADETTGFTITNTHTPAPTPTPETKSVKVTKVWDDNNNQDGLRTTSVTIKLLADGKDAGKTVTLNESNNWTSTFTNLDAKANGKAITYTVEEPSVPTGYTCNVSGTADEGFTITNTHTATPTPETKSIKVTKVWNDNDNQDGSRPSSITIKLLADGKETKSETLSESNGWTYTFTNLDAKANGTDIVYTVEESSVPTGYTPSISGTAADGFTITNTYTATPTPETKSVKVTKVWDDNNNQDGSRPSSITIKLLADGKDAGKTVTLNTGNSWTSTFSDLDAKANGKDIVYTVEETTVPTGYTVMIKGTADETNGFTVTNTHTTNKKDIPVKKVWDDNNDQDKLRTTSITVKLLANGKATGKTISLTKSNSWTNSFKNLDTKANGIDIVYTVEEVAVPSGYTASITGKADNAGFTITNTHSTEKKNISVKKVWDDNNNKDGIRPTSITIKLLANEKETGKSVTLKATNYWSKSFTDLDIKANGKEIVYTIEEVEVSGYTVTITKNATNTGFIITNTLVNKSNTDDPTTPTDVEYVEEDKVVIATHHLTIHVKATTSSAIKIYTVSGDRLYSIQGTHASFKAPQAGVYIVQVGDKKHKVLVK